MDIARRQLVASYVCLNRAYGSQCRACSPLFVAVVVRGSHEESHNLGQPSGRSEQDTGSDTGASPSMAVCWTRWKEYYRS